MINDIYAYHLSETHTMMTYVLQKDIIKRIYNGAENNRTIFSSFGKVDGVQAPAAFGLASAMVSY